MNGKVDRQYKIKDRQTTEYFYPLAMQVYVLHMYIIWANQPHYVVSSNFSLYCKFRLMFYGILILLQNSDLLRG